jgi:hypothetical protein
MVDLPKGMLWLEDGLQLQPAKVSGFHANWVAYLAFLEQLPGTLRDGVIVDGEHAGKQPRLFVRKVDLGPVKNPEASTLALDEDFVRREVDAFMQDIATGKALVVADGDDLP